MSYTKANKYNAFCFQCRKLAGMEPAGIPEDDLCEYHGREESTRIRAELAAKGKEIEQLKTEKEIIRISCNCCEYRIAETAYREVESHLQKEIERLKEQNDKFMWQVRDTCASAEKAENLVAKYKNYYEVTANELTEINKQLKQVEAENAALREEINNPKRTFCAWCGYTVEIDDDAATGIAEHVRTCEKHPLNIEIDALRERLKPVEEVYKKHEVLAREWLSTAPVSSRSRMLEFWQAICKTMEGK